MCFLFLVKGERGKENTIIGKTFSDAIAFFCDSITSAGKRKFRDHLSSSTLKGTTRGLVGFSRLELLDNGFSRWRWGGIEISALLY